MFLPQAKTVVNMETYGWVLNDLDLDRGRLLCGLPVLMRNLRKDLAYIYPDGTMRSVTNEFTLARSEDYAYNGTFKKSADEAGKNHVYKMYCNLLYLIQKGKYNC